jgi:hypothetical protein
LEREKIGEEPLRVFIFFQLLFQIYLKVNRNTTLKRKGMEIASFLLTAAGLFCLISYWLVGVIFGHFPAAFLLYTLSARPIGCPIAFMSISQQLLGKTSNCCPFSSKQPCKISTH